MLVPMETTAESPLSSQSRLARVCYGHDLCGLALLRHSELAIDGLTLTPRTCSPLAACEELELNKAIEPRPHPQPRKFHSLDVGPEALESGNVAQW